VESNGGELTALAQDGNFRGSCASRDSKNKQQH
jgi:hypothetical protein